jgi:hypothetical protein
MSGFKKCADAIRQNGLKETADLVAGLAAKTPRMFAVVSISESNYGDEILGFEAQSPKVFLTRKSAKLETRRLTCELLQNSPTSELLERIDAEVGAWDADFLSKEITRILGSPFTFPPAGVDYWNNTDFQEPLLPSSANEEQTLEVAKLLTIKFFKVTTIPCDTNLTTPDEIPEEPKRPFRKSRKDSSSIWNWLRGK